MPGGAFIRVPAERLAIEPPPGQGKERFMGRIRARLRSLLHRSPWWVLLCLALASIGTGYLLVRCLQFEYHLRSARQALDRESFEEAGVQLARCLQLDPESGRAHFLAARTARRTGQFDFAEEELTTCDDLRWPPAAVNGERTLLAIQRGEFAGADEAFLERARAEGSPDRFVTLEALAQGYMKIYYLMEALECLDRWVEGQPDSPGARTRRGWVYERLERMSDAEKDYRHILEVRPNHPAAQLRLAQLLLQQRMADEAARLFEELHAQSAKDPAIDLGLAQCYVALGRKEEARVLLDELARQQPNDLAVLLSQGELALAERRLPEAKVWLERATVVAPHAYEPHYQLFLCLQGLGESVEAGFAEKRFKAIETDLKRMNELTLALRRRPADPVLRFQIAGVFLRRGEEAEGIAWLESVVRLVPSHAKARQSLVDLYERSGKPRQARAHRQALAGLDRQRPR